jgi:hypothetical protein
LRRFDQKIAKKLVDSTFSLSPRRSVELRSFANKGFQQINRDYLPDVSKSANDLVESVPSFPEMPRRGISRPLFIGSARFSFSFESLSQFPAKCGKKFGQLFVRAITGKSQFRLSPSRFIPSIGDPFRTIGDKTAKFR